MDSVSAPSPVLEAENVSKRFGGVHALKEVSLTVHPGEVLALAGDNGAGKSTLIKIISGVHHADGGSLRYAGKEIKFDNPQQARDCGIETIYQDLALADNLDVGANVFLGREPVRRIFGLPVIDRRLMREEAEKTLRALGRAIHWKARVLIMDEPTAALGVPEQRKVMELITNLKGSGVGIIFISHNLIDIFQVSDRIMVLRRGSKVGEVRTSETNPDAIVRLMVGG
jgi:ABC-type sugar transport system ATPase subunit